MRRLLLLLLVLLGATLAQADVKYLSTVTQPTEPTDYSTDPLSLTVSDTGRVANDYLVLVICARANVTWTMPCTANQTWTSETVRSSTVRSCQIWHARYDGDFADPDAGGACTDSAITLDASATPNNHTAFLMAFRDVDTTTALETTTSGGTFEDTELSSGAYTITGGTTTHDGSQMLYCWYSVDDNAWTLATGSNLTNVARVRNGAGLDSSLFCARKTLWHAGASGAETADETDLGESDNGVWLWIALRPVADATTPCADTYDFQESVGSPPESHSTEDGYMSSAAATTNYNTGTGYLGYWTISSSAYRLLTNFHIQSLTGRTVTAATLTYYVTAVTTPSAGKISRLRRADWVEPVFTWNNYLTGTAWGTAGAANTTTDYDTTNEIAYTAPVGTGSWTAATGSGLVTLVQDAIDTRNGDLLLRLKQDTESGDAFFNMDLSESTTAAQRPKLSVTFTCAAGARNRLLNGELP